MPSIAYRLALVAAGEADATVSTGGPTTWVDALILAERLLCAGAIDARALSPA